MSRRPLAALLAAIVLSAFGAASAEAAPDCRHLDHAGHSYSVCTVDLAASDLRLFWRDAAGAPFRTIRAVSESLPAGEALSFGMNAGMFDGAFAPVGLYVEDGHELVAANTNDGPGNFHLMPNGIFYWNGDSAGILETHRFLAERPAATFATQSGPMLLIEGEVHPRFLPDSDSRKLRNGVGILDEHTVVFALTDQAVTFYEFALMFRDALGVRDALYLDGSVSAMYAPEIGRTGAGLFGPILGVVER